MLGDLDHVLDELVSNDHQKKLNHLLKEND